MAEKDREDTGGGGVIYLNVDLANLLKPFTADAVMNGAATLVGAFLGAMLAFLIQLYFQRKQERKAALMSAHRMLFCLLQQINTLLLVQKDFIFPYLKESGHFISIPAMQEFDIKKDIFDFATFSFMLETSESRKIMYDLYLAQESYVEALRALNERSRLHRHEVQPRLASSNIQNGTIVTLNVIEKLLGPFVYPSIVNTTEQVKDSLKGAFTKLEKSKHEFRAYAVKLFRTKDFTNFDFPDTYGLTSESKTS
jgi:hypothetical protein